MSDKMNYRDAGVDIEAGEALVDAIKPAIKATTRTGSVGGIGGFGGIFDIAKTGYRDPLLISATDGVGTKLRVAFEAGNHHTVGIDLVAMCVNDLIVQGAEPLFFLDYFATSRLDVERATFVITGIAEGCKQAGCALIGGETAELPGFYEGDDYDLAGFCVGAVERENLLPRADIAADDVIIGLASSGIHSNGYSLVRRIVEHQGLSFGDPAPFSPEQTLGDALLAPTRIYVSSVLSALRNGLGIKALAHITGGGLLDNVPRVLPDHIGASMDLGDVPRLAIFDWLAQSGPVSTDEMARTFNCGVGMVAICPAADADAICSHFTSLGNSAAVIGELTKWTDGPRVQVSNGPGA